MGESAGVSGGSPFALHPGGGVLPCRRFSPEVLNENRGRWAGSTVRGPRPRVFEEARFVTLGKVKKTELINDYGCLWNRVEVCAMSLEDWYSN